MTERETGDRATSNGQEQRDAMRQLRRYVRDLTRELRVARGASAALADALAEQQRWLMEAQVAHRDQPDEVVPQPAKRSAGVGRRLRPGRRPAEVERTDHTGDTDDG
jgi:hypothetical protein